MKIKIDYVTNSSSEVFGVVAGDTAAAAALITMIAVLFKGCKLSYENNEITEPQAEKVAVDASGIAEELANAVIKDAERQDNIVKDAYNEAENTLDSAKTALEQELGECRTAWEESERTADKTDPGYDKLKQQYDDYIDYLKGQIQQTEYQKQQVVYEKAQQQAEMDSKSEWIRQQQADYIAAKEEQAMLAAVAKGYDRPGYNIDSVKERLGQLEAKQAELSRILEENGASFEYNAKDRGVIGPSQESLSLTDKIRNERDAFEKSVKKANAERKAQLEADMEMNISEYQSQIQKANRYELAEKAAEGIQFGADTAIEGLSYVTGPAGQKIKLAYTAGKQVASGMGEGMADPKNAARHLAKGILNAGAEVIKDKFGEDKPWQAAATGILNESLQKGLDASIKGENVIDAMGKGLTKGVFDAGTEKALDKIKDKLPITKGSSVDVGSFDINRILNNNPLSKGLARTVVREGAGKQIKDALKDSIVRKTGEAAGFIDSE